MRPLATLFVLALVSILSACTRGAEEPKPNVGGAACASCGRPIADERFAAQYRLDDGTVKSFDDPACLFRALREESSEPAVIRFRAYTVDQWLPAEQTWFAHASSIRSPHGDGWAAFASFGDAQDAVAAAGNGEILSFAQARQRLAAAVTPGT